jgi:EAL and modified HD-GYP domain-containing signal transduction protein
MLNRLVGMFRGNRAARRTGGEGAARHPDAFLRLNAVAPLVSEIHNPPVTGTVHAGGMEAAPPGKSIVCREAVLGGDQRVAGYAFSLRYEINQRVRASSTNVQRLYDGVLLRNLQMMEVQRLLGHRLAFIDVSASSLDMPFLEDLLPQGTVYVVRPNAQPAANLDACLTRLRRLKSLGYRIGLRGSGADTAGILPFLGLADFLFVDIAGNDIPAIHDQLDVATRQDRTVKCVAANVQTLEEFGVCARMPFSFFQGPFVTSREKWETPRLDASHVKILQLLNQVRSEAEGPELVAVIRQDPALSFRLLRFINSPGMGLLHRIGTLDQALLVLGRQKLYRWLTLLLFTSGRTRGLDAAVMENALVRARLAELVAQDSLSADERDEVFVAGVFSLLDIVLAVPMEAVLEQVNLPPLVDEALRHRRGRYAPYLDLAIACEQSDCAGISALSRAVGMEETQVNACHVEALLWAMQVSE